MNWVNWWIRVLSHWKFGENLGIWGIDANWPNWDLNWSVGVIWNVSEWLKLELNCECVTVNSGSMTYAHSNEYNLNSVAPIGVRLIGDEN